jgi:hypothetical protein
VKVSGFVDGARGRTNVDIDVNGVEKASVSTQPDGYYQTYIRVDSVGMKTVRAQAEDSSASRQIDVLATARVSNIRAPRQVFEGENFTICSQVTSQIDARVLLIRDGEVVESTNGNGQVCFDREAYQPGNHEYEVTGISPAESSSAMTTVNVLENDVEAESFPNQVASVESESGMVKVELYNTHEEVMRYDLELNGLPSTWTAQTEKQVLLNTGESETVFFYLTPRGEGDYDPEVVVSGDNQEIYRQKVDLEVGGQKTRGKRSFVSRIFNLLF